MCIRDRRYDLLVCKLGDYYASCGGVLSASGRQFDFKRSVSADLYCCFSRLLGCPVEDADRLGRKADAAFAIRQKEEIVKVQRFVEPSEKDKPQYGQF